MGKYRSEWKYCIDNVSLQPIKERLLAIMDRDSHANENGNYEIHSLYFDDFQNTCARENMAGDGIRYKYRIRYYGNNSHLLFLEKKSKNNSFCNKRSCKITKEQFERIIDDDVGDLFWETQDKLLQEFCLAVVSKGFKPKVIVNYEREAFVEPINNVRITFDSSISSSNSFDQFLDSDYRKVPILPENMNVMEVKFDDVLPAYIRKMLQVERVNQRSFSKYYLCRIALQDFLNIQ